MPGCGLGRAFGQMFARSLHKCRPRSFNTHATAECRTGCRCCRSNTSDASASAAATPTASGRDARGLRDGRTPTSVGWRWHLPFARARTHARCTHTSRLCIVLRWAAAVRGGPHAVVVRVCVPHKNAPALILMKTTPF